MLGHGQEVEDPAAAVVDADDLERHAGAARGEQAADVVLEGQLADQDPGRAGRVAIAAPSADETTPSIPFAPRLARKRSALRRLREVGLDVADRHRRADPDERLVGQLRLERGEDLALEVVGRRLDRRPAPSRRPLRQPSSQPVIALGPDRISTAAASASRVGAAAACSTSSARPRGLVPGAVRIDHDLRRLGHSARSGFDVGMSPTRSTRPGACSRANVLDAEQHVVVRDHVGAVVVAAAHARGRLGEQRPAGLRRPAGPPARRRPR